MGKLTCEDGEYCFSYLQGAIQAQKTANFQPLWSFPDLFRRYRSAELFPLFANRLLRPSRPEYQDFVQWLNIPEQKEDPIALLARSGGKRKTDSFEVFPCPERDANDTYHIHFFAHGLRHCPEAAQQQVQSLKPETPLFIIRDLQNQFDSHALLLRTENLHCVGYCPRYLTQDFCNLICQSPQQVKVAVERINLPPTPLQFRLLCNFTASWEEDFQPFSSDIYQEVSQNSAKSSAIPASASI